jgi:sarcosine oxidase subunit beta
MGASITYHLSKQKAGGILLLERQALCSGTTARSGAIVRQHYSNDFTIRIAKESLYTFQHFDEIIGGDCGFVTTGMLVIVDDSGVETLQANVTFWLFICPGGAYLLSTCLSSHRIGNTVLRFVNSLFHQQI